jgi:hypothetical protein
MLTQIYHKKNELFEVEFFKDKECTQLITDWSEYQNVYIELKDGNISPITAIDCKLADLPNLYVPYIPNCHKPYHNEIKTLDDITPNLSKYIPEDNAVLFLDFEHEKKYGDCFKNREIYTYIDGNLHGKSTFENIFYYGTQGVMPKITIFLPPSKESILEYDNIVQELKEKYGVEEVNVFMLHCFVNQDYIDGYAYNEYDENNKWKATHITLSQIRFDLINKIITTNSTGILEPQNNERLQVINCKKIFEEYFKENN